MQELEKEKHQKAIDEGNQGPDVDKPILKFMISGEAPVLMSKACELLIKDLSFRAWRHTERNRRRTLQRQDLHAAVGESEVYDFLIDIVPRVTTPKSSVANPVDAAAAAAAAMTPPLPSGVPIGGIPTGLPSVAAPMATTPNPGQTGMDNNMMHQMQQQHGQSGIIQHQYPDSQQQHHYQYIGMPQAPSSDLNQNSSQVSVGTGSQSQQVQQWATQAVHESGSNPQAS